MIASIISKRVSQRIVKHVNVAESNKDDNDNFQKLENSESPSTTASKKEASMTTNSSSSSACGSVEKVLALERELERLRVESQAEIASSWKEIEELQKEKYAFERRCRMLEEENRELKQLVQETNKNQVTSDVGNQTQSTSADTTGWIDYDQKTETFESKKYFTENTPTVENKQPRNLFTLLKLRRSMPATKMLPTSVNNISDEDEKQIETFMNRYDKKGQPPKPKCMSFESFLPFGRSSRGNNDEFDDNNDTAGTDFLYLSDDELQDDFIYDEHTVLHNSGGALQQDFPPQEMRRTRRQTLDCTRSALRAKAKKSPQDQNDIITLLENKLDNKETQIRFLESQIIALQDDIALMSGYTEKENYSGKISDCNNKHTSPEDHHQRQIDELRSQVALLETSLKKKERSLKQVLDRKSKEVRKLLFVVEKQKMRIAAISSDKKCSDGTG